MSLFRDCQAPNIPAKLAKQQQENPALGKSNPFSHTPLKSTPPPPLLFIPQLPYTFYQQTPLAEGEALLAPNMYGYTYIAPGRADMHKITKGCLPPSALWTWGVLSKMPKFYFTESTQKSYNNVFNILSIFAILKLIVNLILHLLFETAARGKFEIMFKKSCPPLYFSYFCCMYIRVIHFFQKCQFS